jgi:hypothetical protein
MGLDMYLTKRHYVKNWDRMQPKDRHDIRVKRGGKARPDIKPERISEIVEDVGYWRKANAIHKWFVEHVQGGRDDCGHYYVSREQLEQLKSACDKVLANSKLRKGKVTNGYVIDSDGRRPIVEDGEVITDTQIAETVLPTASGFFFGSTDYDGGYHEDIKYTSDMLAGLLAEEGVADFYYHSSW